MAIFVDTTDFNNESLYYIPNQSESEWLDNFLTTTEREVLEMLLCYEFSNELLTEFSGSGDPSAEWLAFRDGAEFEYNGDTYKWRGLVDLLCPAIYAIWLEKNFMKVTNIGTGQNQKDQFTTLPPDILIVKNNNEFVKKAWTLWGWLEENEAYFPLWESEFCYPPKIKNTLNL
jgi:hypothetical protein